MKKFFEEFAVGLMIFGTAGIANAASLQGDSIHADESINWVLGQEWATVSTAVEFSHSLFGTDTWSADFQDDEFTLKVSTTTGIGGIELHWKFDNLDFDDGSHITGVQLISFSGTSFDNPSRISFGDDFVDFHMENLNLISSIDGGLSTWGTFKIITSSPDPVPEPATVILLGTGLAGFAAVRRKRAC